MAVRAVQIMGALNMAVLVVLVVLAPAAVVLVERELLAKVTLVVLVKDKQVISYQGAVVEQARLGNLSLITQVQERVVMV